MQRLTPVSMAGILGLCTTHPWKTVGGWVVAMVVAVLLIATLLTTAISTQEKFTTVPESQVAAQLLTHLRGDVQHATEVVIVRSNEVTVTDPVFRAFVDTLSATIEALAPACRRGPMGAAPTVHPDPRDGAGAGPWPLYVSAWLTLLNPR